MSLKAKQSGITLVEVIVAMAITSAIIGGLSTAIYMIISTTQRGNDEVSAMMDLQNASYSISLDVQMANATDLIDGAQPVDTLNLEWVDCNGDIHHCSYSLSGNELQRNLDNNVRSVAWYISSIGFSISGDLLTYNIQSTPTGRWNVSKDIVGEICLRPNT